MWRIGPAAATVVAAFAALAETPAVDHATFDAILRAVVRGDAVDYGALRRDHRASLAAYLDRLAGLDPSRLERNEQIALYVNLYNATVLAAVADRYRPGYRVDADSFALFREPLVRVSGRTLSLDDLEKRVLLTRFDDPRIHAALVCASRSCPPLAPRAFTGPGLDQALGERMRSFLRDPSRNAIDRETRTLRLSRIFEWYADDFGGAERLAAFVARHAGEPTLDFQVEFLPYSWELNDARSGATSSSPGPSARPDPAH